MNSCSLKDCGSTDLGSAREFELADSFSARN
jgi:hypothetical protein